MELGRLHGGEDPLRNALLKCLHRDKIVDNNDQVIVLAIGEKIGNRLFIGGEEVEL